MEVTEGLVKGPKSKVYFLNRLGLGYEMGLDIVIKLVMVKIQRVRFLHGSSL